MYLMFFSAFYFLFCLSWTVSLVSAQLREEIFDSAKQNTSQWTFRPSGAWNETKLQLGKDYEHSVYKACNPQFKNEPKILWTNWIPRKDARELLLDLSFAQVDNQLLEIYVRESDETQATYTRKPSRKYDVAVRVLHLFAEDSVPQDKDLTHPKNIQLGKISKSGFFLGFSYSGYCMFIVSVQVFFRKCPVFARNQMEFEETAAGVLRGGVCVNGAVEISAPMMECQSNGTWGPPSGSCACDVGYQPDGNSCTGNFSSPVLTAVIVAAVLILLFFIAGVFFLVRRRKLRGGQELELIASFGITQYRRPTDPEPTNEPELVSSCRTGSSNQRGECVPSSSRQTAHGEESSQLENGYERLQTKQPQLEQIKSDSEIMDVMKDRLHFLQDVLVERTELKMSRKLGKGEFGVIYEGIFSPQKGQDIRVAVKTAKDAIHRNEDLESFLKEAEIMMHFNHVNIVKLLGVALERDPESSIIVPLVILPYMKHRDLHSFLKATRYGDVPMFVPHQSLLRFMIDIAAGMEYLSLQGLIHRDLAARNCMLGDDLRVCVADFGLSKRIYSSNYYRHTNADVKLPVRWMAIESVCDLIFTTKSDVWSFGITMWEITSRGKIPYPGLSNHELLDFLEKGHRLSQGDNDRKLYEVMLSCWHADPSQRPGFGELGQSLRALLSELPELEASEESHYINLGLEVASHSQDREESLEPVGAAGNIYTPKPEPFVPLNREDKEEDLLCSHSYSQ